MQPLLPFSSQETLRQKENELIDEYTCNTALEISCLTYFY